MGLGSNRASTGLRLAIAYLVILFLFVLPYVLLEVAACSMGFEAKAIAILALLQAAISHGEWVLSFDFADDL